MGFNSGFKGLKESFERAWIAFNWLGIKTSEGYF